MYYDIRLLVTTHFVLQHNVYNDISQSLSGLDSIPTDFAAQDALSFDEELFEVSQDELKSLSELFPKYSHLLFPVSFLIGYSCNFTFIECT